MTCSVLYMGFGGIRASLRSCYEDARQAVLRPRLVLIGLLQQLPYINPMPAPGHDSGLESMMVQQAPMHVNVFGLCATVPMSAHANTQTKPLQHPQCQHRHSGT